LRKHLITLALAFGLSAIGPAAHAGKPCPFNDKEQPEKSKVCRAGTIQQCEDGQWVNLGIKCTSRLREGGYAALTLTRIAGDAGVRRDTIVARIAPQS
jgi:hypothetical protein